MVLLIVAASASVIAVGVSVSILLHRRSARLFPTAAMHPESEALAEYSPRALILENGIDARIARIIDEIPRRRVRRLTVSR